MIKDKKIHQSIEWINSIQNKDGGWGMYDYDPSRIVTTAEAVTALAIVGSTNTDHLKKGVEYLVKKANDPEWCKYHRHHAWTVYALTRSGYKDQIPGRCIKALQKNHIKGGWGHAPGEPSNIFPTFLGWRALNEIGTSKKILEQVHEWTIRHFNGNWAFEKGKPSYAATSYAVLSLTSNPEWKNKYGDTVQKAVKFILTGSEQFWPNENEGGVSGDLIYNFHHFTLPWAIMALISSEIPITNPAIRSATNHLYNNFYWSPTGGWAEEINHRPSVFGTSHTIAALEVIYKSFTINHYLQKEDIDSELPQPNNKNVFIVHGHDLATKQEVARFIEKLNCNPIILDEQIESGSKTIFEKFTSHAEQASYAIVLMTPDDITGNSNPTKRARQNVILEFGFFVGTLGASKVCLAKKGDVEIPSDISGVLYLNLDDGGWKLSLAQKLRAAGLNIDLSKLILF